MNWQWIKMRFLPQWGVRIVTALSAILLGFDLTAADADELKPVLIGYAKAGPFKETVQKITEVVRKIQPSPQVDSFPYMIGGMLGDPTLDSISATENITVFLYNTPDMNSASFLILAKLTEESPIRATLPMQGFTIQDHEGWSMISRDPKMWDLVENVDSLIKIAERKRNSDVEFGLWLNRLKDASDTFKNEIIDDLEKDGRFSDEADKATIAGFLDIIFGELTSLDSVLLGLNFTPEDFVFQSVLKANSEAPLGKLFSQEPSAIVRAGDYIAEYSMLTYMLSIDPMISGEYLNYIMDAVIDVSENEWKPLMMRIKAIYNRFMQKIDGTVAGSMNISNTSVVMRQIGGADFSSDEFAELIAVSIKFMEDFASKLTLEGETAYIPLYEFKADAFAVKGVPVHTLKSRFNFTGNPDPQDETDNPTNDREQGDSAFFASQTYHYAVCNGYYLSSSDTQGVSDLITRVKSNHPVSSNLNTIIMPKPGICGQFRFDLKRSLMITADLLENTSPETAISLREKIESSTLEPVTSELGIGDAKLIFRFTAPWESMATWASLMKIVDEEASQQNVPSY